MFDSLTKQATARQRQAFRAGTRANHKTHLKAYLSFCMATDQVDFPATVIVITAYMEFLTRKLVCPDSIMNYVSSVKTFHKMLGMDIAAFESFSFHLTQRGIRHTLDHGHLQKLPITPDMLHSIVEILSTKNKVNAVLKCLFIVAFFSFLRCSNLLQSSKLHSHMQSLKRRDIIETNVGIMIVIRWTKTIQCRERHTIIPLSAIPNSPLCPLEAYRNMLKVVPAKPDDPLFVLSFGKSKIKALTPRHAATILKSLISLMGKDPSMYSMHSFRRGGCTLAFNANVETELIKLHGTWSSDAYLAYAQPSAFERFSVTKRMARLL